MKLTGSRVYPRPAPVPKMPSGLVEIMEGLAKDVLRHNPENVYEFCAGHMQKLLEIRDGAPSKKQMTLDEKIKMAQDKIRERIKIRRLQEREKSREIQDKSIIINEPVAEIILENNDLLKQLVEHDDESKIAHEVEIFHEPDMSKTAIDDSDLNNPENISDTGKTLQNDESTNVTEEAVKDPNTNIQEDLDAVDNVEKDASVSSNHLEAEKPAIAVQEEIKLNEDGIASGTPRRVEANNQISTIDEPIVDVVQVVEEFKNPTIICTDENTESGPPNDFTSDCKDSLELCNLIDNTTMDTKNIIYPDMTDRKGQIKDLNQTSTKEITLIPDHEDKETLSKNSSDKLSQINETKIEETVNQEKPDVPSDVELLSDSKIIVDTDESHSENHNEKVDSKDSEIEINHEESFLESPLEKTNTGGEHYNQPQLTIKIETPNQIIEGNGHPINSEFHSEIVEKMLVSENLEHLEHSNGHVDLQHRLNDADLPKIDEDVFDNLLKQEPRSSELAVVKNDTENTIPVKNNKEDTIVEDEEPGENPVAMDLETAAITIQKVFRTFLFSKSRASTLEDTMPENYLKDTLEDIDDKKDEPEYVIPSTNLNKERRTLGISRMDTVLQTVNEEKSLSLSTDDSSTLSSAATTIQAHVRGFLTRNRLTSHKTGSSSSLVNSDGPSTISLDGDINEPKKTILNIHIVPERGQFMSRDESMLTSIDLPLDSSPPSSINLHPLGYDKSEPRKQLKREDAIQSVSPPSNNSGKLSEEVDSVKDVLNENSNDIKQDPIPDTAIPVSTSKDKLQDGDTESCDTTLTISSAADTVIDAELYNTREISSSPEHNSETGNKEAATNLSPDKEDLLSSEHQSQAGSKDAVIILSSDEMDVVTPFPNSAEKTISSPETEMEDKPKLLHSGEFHDIVVQTQVKRSESSVVRGE